MNLDVKQIDAVVEKIVARLSQAEPAPLSGIKTGDGIFQNIDEAVQATHRAQRDLVERTSIEKRKDAIPTDNYKPLEIAQLCADVEESPYDLRLHPGAARFYRDRGYLK